MSGNKQENRKEQAFRILEALSEVDGELLERSEETCAAGAETAGKETKGGARLYLFLRRHTKACAACLCLLICGAALWAVNGAAGKDTSDTRSGAAQAYRDSSMETALQEEETAMEAADTAGLNAAGNSAGQGAPQDGDAAQAGETGAEAAKAGDAGPETAQAEGAGIEAETAEDEGAGIEAELEELQGAMDAAREPEDQAGIVISWEEAYQTEVLGKYIPKSLPEGYEPQTAVRSGTAGSAGLTLTWSDGKRTLTLCLTETGGELPEAELPVYGADGDWKKEILETADGRISFRLLLADGVLAECEGYLTEEELAALLEGIGNE